MQIRTGGRTKVNKKRALFNPKPNLQKPRSTKKNESRDQTTVEQSANKKRKYKTKLKSNIENTRNQNPKHTKKKKKQTGDARNMRETSHKYQQ